jgi:hypothetical protein
MRRKNPASLLAAFLALLVGAVTWFALRETEEPAKPAAPASPSVPTSNSSGPGVGKAPTVPMEKPTDAPSASTKPATSADLPAPRPTAPMPSPVASQPPAPVVPPTQTPPVTGPIDREVVLETLENVHFALRDYRAALGGNPVGTNAEVTAALLGDNPKQMKLPLPEKSRINGAGELCDPWGTPYFFHQISATKMEVRSAGPDQKLWTGDDIQQ